MTEILVSLFGVLGLELIFYGQLVWWKPRVYGFMAILVEDGQANSFAYFSSGSPSVNWRRSNPFGTWFAIGLSYIHWARRTGWGSTWDGPGYWLCGGCRCFLLIPRTCWYYHVRELVSSSLPFQKCFWEGGQTSPLSRGVITIVTPPQQWRGNGGTMTAAQKPQEERERRSYHPSTINSSSRVQ